MQQLPASATCPLAELALGEPGQDEHVGALKESHVAYSGYVTHYRCIIFALLSSNRQRPEIRFRMKQYQEMSPFVDLRGVWTPIGVAGYSKGIVKAIRLEAERIGS
jgi:hypothetical protein